jgi:hypothetical protein
MATKTRLTTRGWIVLVIIPVLLLVSLFTYATRDVCWVGTDKDYAKFLGYGSCDKYMNDYLEWLKNNPINPINE